MTPSRARAQIQALLAVGALGLAGGQAHAETDASWGDAAVDGGLDEADVPTAVAMYEAPTCAVGPAPEARDPGALLAALLLGGGLLAARRRGGPPETPR